MHTKNCFAGESRHLSGRFFFLYEIFFRQREKISALYFFKIDLFSTDWEQLTIPSDRQFFVTLSKFFHDSFEFMLGYWSIRNLVLAVLSYRRNRNCCWTNVVDFIPFFLINMEIFLRNLLDNNALVRFLFRNRSKGYTADQSIRISFSVTR